MSSNKKLPREGCSQPRRQISHVINATRKGTWQGSAGLDLHQIKAGLIQQTVKRSTTMEERTVEDEADILQRRDSGRVPHHSQGTVDVRIVIPHGTTEISVPN
jgi:hypothetical protein